MCTPTVKIHRLMSNAHFINPNTSKKKNKQLCIKLKYFFSKFNKINYFSKQTISFCNKNPEMFQK